MTGRVVGVLGGMGPAATLDFLARLQAATGASRDAEHLRVLVDINPHVPDRNRALAGDGPAPGAALAAMARGLAAQGAELLCMPCNSAHAWADEIRGATAVPFVSIIDAASAATRAAGGRPGLLAADAALAAGLYDAALPDAVKLDTAGQARFMTLLARIKGGDTGTGASAEMASLAGLLIDGGARTIVAACTEVPLVLRPDMIAAALVDPTQALAEEVVRQAKSG